MVSFSVFIWIPFITVWWGKCWCAYHERSYSWPNEIKTFSFFPSYNGILFPLKSTSGSKWQICNKESSNIYYHGFCNDSAAVKEYHCRFHKRHVPDRGVFTNMQLNVQENIISSQTRREIHLGRHVTLENGILKTAEAPLKHSRTNYIRSSWCYFGRKCAETFTTLVRRFCVPASQNLQPIDYIARAEFCL